MAQRTIGAAEFKAKCLALLDEVAETKEELVVTKRGRPVAQTILAAAVERACSIPAFRCEIGRLLLIDAADLVAAPDVPLAA